MKNIEKYIEEALYLGGFKTKKNLAKYLDISPSAINQWIKEGNIPKRHLKKIQEAIKNNGYCEVNITPIPDEPTAQQVSDTIPIPKFQCTASAGGGNHIEGIDTFETSGTLIIDKDTLRVDYKNLRAIKVDGYSMIPILLPDSWVIFDDTDHFVGDGLYVINFRNILMVKTLQVNSEGKLRIISANKEYESYTVDMDDQSVFKIFGKVRKCII